MSAFVDFPYQKIEIDLKPSDTILVLIDGLVELYKEEEMCDYHGIENAFQEVTEQSL